MVRLGWVGNAIVVDHNHLVALLGGWWLLSVVEALAISLTALLHQLVDALRLMLPSQAVELILLCLAHLLAFQLEVVLDRVVVGRCLA